MIECNRRREILTFDGRIISRYFARGSSEHFHIDHIGSVEITADKKGRQRLIIIGKDPDRFKPQHTFGQLLPEEIPQAQAFVDEIQKAIAAS
jgi:hypothetical protein